jgi:uncharacterized membrane protein (GlpM family)
MTKRREPMVGVSSGALREVPRGDLAVRFAFGVVISAVAAIIATVAGSHIGGIFLAFPSILPATLTLIEKEDSKREAEDEDVGAVLGATSLFGFAGTCWLLLPRIGAAGALDCAAAVWLVAAICLYVAFRKMRPRK